MRKFSSKRDVLKYRKVIIYYSSSYDGRVHRKIFKDCTLFEALAFFYVMVVFHCWTFVDCYCIKY